MDYLQYFFLGKKERHVPELIVLNLIINGLPSILSLPICLSLIRQLVLNLIINGLPSILQVGTVTDVIKQVLNLIINGLPSILIKGYCI